MTVETAHNGRPLLRDTDGGLKMCEIRMTGGWGRTILVMTLADVPSNYRGQQGLEALRNLPVAWDETHCLGGEIGSWYVVERKSPDGRRYLAVITAGARHLSLPLAFLGPGRWRMALYSDDPKANRTDACALRVSQREVSSADKLDLDLAPIGGMVAVFDLLP